MPTEGDAGLRRLLAMAEDAAAPSLTAEALDQRFGQRSSWAPLRGQIWRAVRDDVTALVVLVEVDQDQATVVPITIDTPTGEFGAVEIRDTAFGVPIAAWPHLRLGLPVRALDRPVDQVPPNALLGIVGLASSTGSGVSTESRDERVAELVDDLAFLAVSKVEASTAATAGAETERIDIDSLDSGMFDEAARRLGVSMPAILDLIDGKQPPTPEQAAILRQVFGAAPTAISLPSLLISDLSQPRWRALVRRRRDHDRTSEDAARSALAYDIYAMAARQTGEQEPAWHDRILRWAQMHDLDPDVEA